MTTEHKYLIRGLLRELHLVSQWKDNCVYRTRLVGKVVFSSDAVPYKPNRDIVQASISTKESRRILGI